MKINRIVILLTLIILFTLTSCNTTSEPTQEEIPYVWSIGGTSRTTNYQYEKVYTQAEFESFLRGENPTLIGGYPELLYDDTILLGYFETQRFFRTENAYYLQAKQHPQKNVMYRFEQVGDSITGYIKYDLLRS